MQFHPESPMAPPRSAAANTLPSELLSQVFDFFNGSAPSDDRLYHQPRSDMLEAHECPLKNISLVSKRWRAIALPMLFRCVVWTLGHCDPLVAKPAGDRDPSDKVAILAFLRAANLARHVRSFTIIVHPNQQPSSLPVPPDPPSYSLSGTAAEPTMAHHRESDWLWSVLFGLIDPLKFTIIASPQTLARLLSCMLFVGDADCFPGGERLHILSLARNSRSSTQSPAPPPNTSQATSLAATRSCSRERKHTPCALFTIRPWTHLLLNENSSIPIYRHYHFFERRPPSILGPLLGCEEPPNDVPMVPPTVSSLSYVAIFPLSSQFSTLVDHLPRVEHLFLQLAPCASSTPILLHPREMDRVQPSDLWMERRSCHEFVVRRLMSAGAPAGVPSDTEGGNNDHQDDGQFGGSGTGGAYEPVSNARSTPAYNWRFVRRFETSDAAEEKASGLAERLCQAGWRMEREGVFIRRPAPKAAA